MQSEPLLSVILNIENSQENLNRSLGALFACKNERPVEVRAAVRAGKFAAPQILSVYQRSSALFSFTLCGEESPEQSVAKEIEKASGKYVLVADGGDIFPPTDFPNSSIISGRSPRTPCFRYPRKRQTDARRAGEKLYRGGAHRNLFVP